MRNFLKVFVLLEIMLFTYIFNSSIYNIYEKNNIASNGLYGYTFEDGNSNNLDRFYDMFMENYPEYKLETIHNTLTSTDKSVYELHCYPINDFSRRQPISQTMQFEYYELTKEDFLDSVGNFYTNVPYEKLLTIASELETNIKPFKDNTIPYNMVFNLNILNFAILLVIIQIIYCIYTSYSFKKIGIKKSMGFSSARILKEQIFNIVRYYVVIYVVIGFIQDIFYILSRRFTFSYFIFRLIFFLIALLLNIIAILNTSVLIKLVNLEAMIKNKTLNISTNIFVQFVKIVFSIMIAFTVITLLKQSNQYKDSQKAVLDYKYLEGYYTANGFNSVDYDYALNNLDILLKYSDSMKELYTNNNSLLCDSSALNINKSDIASSRPYYETHFVIANKNYLNNFSNINTAIGNLNTSKIDTPTILVPKKYKEDESVIRDFVLQQYYRLLNYNQFYHLQEETRVANNYDIIYVEDNSTIKINTEKGFSDMSGNIIILDTGEFDGLYYLDSLNTRSIFFELDSREQFSKLLTDYGLGKLVTAGTLLTPYLMELEGVTFVLKTIIIFAIVFIVSLMFILYMSNYVDVFVNKQRYALKEIMGFSHSKILKNRYFLWGIAIGITVIFSIISPYFSCLFLIILIDWVFCELLYKIYIRKVLYEIEKGA